MDTTNRAQRPAVPPWESSGGMGLKVQIAKEVDVFNCTLHGGAADCNSEVWIFSGRKATQEDVEFARTSRRVTLAHFTRGLVAVPRHRQIGLGTGAINNRCRGRRLSLPTAADRGDSEERRGGENGGRRLGDQSV